MRLKLSSFYDHEKVGTMLVAVTYHVEVDGVWADSPDVAGWTAVGASVEEVRTLVREGLPFYLETPDEEIDLREAYPDGSPTVVFAHLAPSLAPGLNAKRSEAEFELLTARFESPRVEGWGEGATASAVGDQQLVG